MAMVIHDDCINCANCEPACPNKAISPGENIYMIDTQRCTECVGVFDQPQCVDVCPIEGCITIDPARIEPREVLLARYEQLRAS